MSGRGEREPGPSRGDHKGKGKAVVKESTNKSHPQKSILPLSGDQPGKGKAKAQQLVITSGGRTEGHLGPSLGRDHKGKVKAVTEESANEHQPSKPLSPSTDWPEKAKSKAQANMVDYILLVKRKGTEKAIGTKDGVLEKRQQRQESIANDRKEEPDLPEEEPCGWSHHYKLKGG